MQKFISPLFYPFAVYIHAACHGETGSEECKAYYNVRCAAESGRHDKQCRCDYNSGNYKTDNRAVPFKQKVEQPGEQSRCNDDARDKLEDVTDVKRLRCQTSSADTEPWNIYG